MLSVDPILERIFFRSGADTLVGGRGGLGTGLVLGATLTVEAFLESTDVLPGPESLGAAGLGRLPGRAGEEVVGVVALLLAVEEVEVLFGQLGSADEDFAVVFLASVDLASVLTAEGLLGGELAVLRGLDALVLVSAVDGRGVAGLLFTPGRGVEADEGGFEGEVRFSRFFPSVPFGFASLGVKVEGRVVPVAGRLGAVAAAVGPAVGLEAFLFGPGVAEAGRLVGAAVVGAGLVFAAADFTVGVEAEGLAFFSGLSGSSLLGGAAMSFCVVVAASVAAGFTSGGFVVGSSWGNFTGRSG